MADEPDEVIISTGMDLSFPDDANSVVLSFRSHGRPPIAVSMPRTVALRMSHIVREKLDQMAQTEHPPASKLN